MHATNLINKNLNGISQAMHKVRYNALMAAVESAISGKCVTVTALGRRSPRDITEKSSINQMDRLVGNVHLLSEATMIYRTMAHWIIGIEKQPLVVIDWSPLSHDEAFHVLRASVPAEGRGMTIYQETHPQAKNASPDIQLQFLEELSKVIPPGCQPIIVTDAGFKNPWFRAVESLEWEWIGRVRGNVQVTRKDEAVWDRATLLGYLIKTDEPTHMGKFLLAKSNPLCCTVYALRKTPKGRVDKTKRGRRSQSTQSRESANGAREPWILVTSLKGGETITPMVIRAYKKRMQIEEAFRDTKNEYYGLGLNRSRSRSAERFTVLLIINTLALFAAWLMGKVAEMRGIQFSYQANTIRIRRVLSFVFLGLRVFSRAPLTLTRDEIKRARCELSVELSAVVPA